MECDCLKHLLSGWRHSLFSPSFHGGRSHGFRRSSPSVSASTCGDSRTHRRRPPTPKSEGSSRKALPVREEGREQCDGSRSAAYDYRKRRNVTRHVFVRLPYQGDQLLDRVAAEVVAGVGFEPTTPGYEPSEIPFLYPASTAGVGSGTSGKRTPGGLGGKPTQPKPVFINPPTLPSWSRWPANPDSFGHSWSTDTSGRC